jgi:hypothetical protein
MTEALPLFLIGSISIPKACASLRLEGALFSNRILRHEQEVRARKSWDKLKIVRRSMTIMARGSFESYPFPNSPASLFHHEKDDKLQPVPRLLTEQIRQADAESP